MAETPGRKHRRSRRRRLWPRMPRSSSPRGDAGAAESYQLSDFGKELFAAGERLDAWLAQAPQGPLTHASDAGSRAATALEAAYASGFLSGLVEQPPPGAVDAGIARELTAEDGSSSYELTDWGRRGIGPILALGRAEAKHRPRTSRLTPRVLSGMLQQLLPLIQLPENTEGIVQLGIDPEAGEPASAAAAFWVQIEAGRIVDSGTGPPPKRSA